MVLTASLCDAPHVKELELGKYRECICRRVAPKYAADLSVPILDRGRKAKEMEIGSSTMYMCRPNYLLIILAYKFSYEIYSFLKIINFLCQIHKTVFFPAVECRKILDLQTRLNVTSI
jgi:hypothetical protein